MILEYYEMCRFVRARMSLAKVRSDILLLCGPYNKGVCILHLHDLKDRAVMALLAPCCG